MFTACCSIAASPPVMFINGRIQKRGNSSGRRAATRHRAYRASRWPLSRIKTRKPLRVVIFFIGVRQRGGIAATRACVSGVGLALKT